MTTCPDDLFERDYVAWVDVQASALRTLAQARPNDPPIDWDHLIETIEGLAMNERAAVRSQIRRILEHLLKLEHSDAEAPRRGWKRSVISARASLEHRLTTTLRREVEADLETLYKTARRMAVQGLEEHDEFPAAEALPDACPYDLGQVLADDWYPGDPA